MKKIGDIIREARLAKRLSIKQLEEETKIKKTFIDAIERENWKDLPDFAVVAGFTRSIAKVLNINEEKTLAHLRRDYPIKGGDVNPKPDISSRFYWSPRITFFLGLSVAVLFFMGYLGFQYNKFINPPSLVIYFPEENQIVNHYIIKVQGKTDSDAVILVNNQGAIVDQDGNFETELEVANETKEIKVIARSRSGKETNLSRKINVNLGE